MEKLTVRHLRFEQCHMRAGARTDKVMLLHAQGREMLLVCAVMIRQVRLKKMSFVRWEMIERCWLCLTIERLCLCLWLTIKSRGLSVYRLDTTVTQFICKGSLVGARHNSWAV